MASRDGNQMVTSSGAPLSFEVAEGRSRLEAVALTRSVYLEDLGKYCDDGLDASAHHLICRGQDDRLIAAVRILGPEMRPFDFEEQVDLDTLLSADRKPGLLARLVVHRDCRSATMSLPVLSGLLEFAIRHAQQHAMTDLLLYTFDYLRTFYRSAGFAPTGHSLQHATWGRVYVMRFDILKQGTRARSGSAR
jgi:predicted GNAT family N-acyltransferase